MADGKAPHWLWFGTGMGSRAVRALLHPAELLYAGAIAVRGAMYDRHLLTTDTPALPVLSIGNLTVGGTGKTPVSAWAAAELAARGARPAIVLRGYGGDEPLVHARLNPGVPVITSAARAAGVRSARNQGCDVAVLDDAFQHRRIERNVDWVLVSADRWSARRRLVPAGPWREPLSSLRRATVTVVTRKAASRSRAGDVLQQVTQAAPGIPAALIHLEPDSLRAVDGVASMAIGALSGTRVLLVAGIGDPVALRQQLEDRGARVRARTFPDHHAFTAAEVAGIAASATIDEIVVCTLKDAVKIGAGWPRAAPALWYVSQRVIVEEGADLLAGSLDTLLLARSLYSDAAHSHGPYL